MDTVRFNCPAGLVRGFMYSVYIYFFLFFFFRNRYFVIPYQNTVINHLVFQEFSHLEYENEFIYI